MPASCYDEGESGGSRRRSGLGSGNGVVLDNQPNPATIAGIARFTAPAIPDRARRRCVETPSDAPGSICG